MSTSITRAAAALAVLGLLAFAGACDKEKGLRITGYEPKSGPYTGGDAVVFKGGGFTDEGVQGAEVWFGDKKAKNVRFRGDSEMIVDTPPGDVGQVVDITIRFDAARTKKLPNAYSYIDPSQGFGVGELVEKEGQ
jgi:hypothetical protein